MWCLQGLLGPGLLVPFVVDIAETAVADDAVFTGDQVLLVEIAEGADSITPTSISYYNTVEVAAADDAVVTTSVQTLDISEVAAGDDIVSTAISASTVSETAVGNDTVALTVSAVCDIIETAIADDASSEGELVDVTEAAVGDDGVVLSFSFILDLVETAVGDDFTTLVAANVVDIEESAASSDAVVSSTASSIYVAESGYITDYAYPEVSSEAIIWTANVYTWAMSKLLGVAFTSLAGDYAAAADGLYARGSSYADIDIEFGWADFGVPFEKGLPYAYSFGAHAKPLTFTVTGDTDGTEGAYSYKQAAYSAKQPRAIRCDFGQGFNSTYFKIGVQSSGYAVLHNVQPIIDTHNRRI